MGKSSLITALTEDYPHYVKHMIICGLRSVWSTHFDSQSHEDHMKWARVLERDKMNEGQKAL